jgi:hypothetical protein
MKPFAVFLILTCSLYAQERGFKPIQQNPPEQRLALVIGNAKYSFAQLRNPENDASDIADALREAHFAVYLRFNLNQDEMKRAIRDFGEHLNPNAVALFYYSGHAVQISGSNFLIPIGARIQKEQDVEFEAVDASRVLAEMESSRSRLNVVILDACRDNPLPRSVRNSSRGLAQMSAPVGTLIAYSTSPGSVASDGDGRNGLYTGRLLKYLREDGLRIEDIFKRVRSDVRKESNGAQITWESNSIEGEFFFRGGISSYGSSQLGQTSIERGERRSEGGFSLASIDTELVENKVGEQKKLAAMRNAFEQVKKLIVDAHASQDKKLLAKQRFLQYFSEELVSTDEDNKMRDQMMSVIIKFIEIEGLSNGYEMSATEVTFDQFDKFCDETGYRRPDSEVYGRGKQPVINVTVADAEAFCKWVYETTGSTVRLPSEEEWEYAARGGNKSRDFTFAGSNYLDGVAWYDENSKNKPHPVGSKMANELGLFDMSGNVWEWCGSEGRVRGGGWSDYDLICRVSYRYSYNPEKRYNDVGFRIVRVK